MAGKGSTPLHGVKTRRRALRKSWCRAGVLSCHPGFASFPSFTPLETQEKQTSHLYSTDKESSARPSKTPIIAQEHTKALRFKPGPCEFSTCAMWENGLTNPWTSSPWTEAEVWPEGTLVSGSSTHPATTSLLLPPPSSPPYPSLFTCRGFS